MDHELNRIQYVIMNIMKKRKATDHMHSMSCEEIRDIENQNRVTTIYKHIRILEANEVLHYMLYIAGMKYKDDTAIFHHLCKEFDASAYKDMSEDEQILFNQLSNAISMMKKMISEKNISEKNYTSNYLSMLITVGSNKENCLYRDVYKNGLELLNLFKLKSEIA